MEDYCEKYGHHDEKNKNTEYNSEHLIDFEEPDKVQFDEIKEKKTEEFDSLMENSQKKVP